MHHRNVSRKRKRKSRNSKIKRLNGSATKRCNGLPTACATLQLSAAAELNRSAGARGLAARDRFIVGDADMNDKTKDIILGVVALVGHSALLWLAFSSLAHLNANPTDMPFELWVVIPCFGAVFLSLVIAFIMLALFKNKVSN